MVRVIIMWIYSQSSGRLWDYRGQHVASGYSGFEEGKNNPKLEALKNVGPIPRGMWVITGLYNSDSVGPFALKLEPCGHNALMRDYFRMHGQSKSNWGRASKGCMIFPRSIRERVWNSGDKLLLVIE